MRPAAPVRANIADMARRVVIVGGGVVGGGVVGSAIACFLAAIAPETD